MRRADLSTDECAIAQALDVVGDWWTLLIIRDLARGRLRFEQIHAGLGASRKVISQRLQLLASHGIVRQHRYQDHPPRHEYHLTDAGVGLLQVLVALQDWGDTWVLGDGTVSATTTRRSPEAARVHQLVGTTIPDMRLPAASGQLVDPVAPTRWTVLYCYPGTAVPGYVHHPPEWEAIPGAVGCTLQGCSFRDRIHDFAKVDATIVGVSTQRADEQAAFARANHITFPLLSDAGLHLTAALRLPTFRAGGTTRLKRLTLLVDDERLVRHVLYPIVDVAGSVVDALGLVGQSRAKSVVGNEAAPKNPRVPRLDTHTPPEPHVAGFG